MSNFLKRSLTAFAFVVIMLIGTLIHPYAFIIVFGAILFFTLKEFYVLTEHAGFQPQKLHGQILSIFYFLICFLTANNLIPKNLVLLFMPFLLFILIGEIFRKRDNSLRNGTVTIFGLIYITLPFSLLNFIVLSGPPSNKFFYPWILLGVFFIIWVYDSAAYISGSLFGKHKIAEKISPGKSWEGFTGGTVFAIITGIINSVLFQDISMFNWIIIALLTVVFGTLGDFFESKIKRELDIKDSGKILPGHGGLLDRFDSLLFAIPGIFVWLSFMDKF